jgi:hypothetical protein
LAQVVLLDPVQYPGAIKAFAREVCRNDLLNFGGRPRGRSRNLHA